MTKWSPPYQIIDRHWRQHPAAGMVIAWEHGAWEVTHVSDPSDGKIRATFRRLYGPSHPRENSYQDVAVTYSESGCQFEEYASGRVWLCSCRGHPVPCRMEVAEKQSTRAAEVFEERLKRMGPGLCYACGEVITTRQGRVTFPGDHADFPGRGGPTFHTRKSCYGERRAYAKRAGVTPDATPLTLEVGA